MAFQGFFYPIGPYGATNYMQNTNAAVAASSVSATGWTLANGATVNLAGANNISFDGPNTFLLSGTNSSAAQIVTAGAVEQTPGYFYPQADKLLRASCYFNVMSGSATLRVTDGTVTVNTAAVTGAVAGWQRAEVNFTSYHGQAPITITALANDASSVVYVSGFQFEALDTGQLLVNGDLDQWGAPVASTPNGWTVSHTANVTQITTVGLVNSGYSSAKVIGNGEFLSQAVAVTPGLSYTLNCQLRVSGSATVTLSDSTSTTTLIVAGNNTAFSLATLARTPVSNSMTFKVAIADVSSFVYVDTCFLSLTANPHTEIASTYIEYTQPDCIPLGTGGLAPSWRSPQSRRGGAIFNFDGMGFPIEKMQGVGMPPISPTIVPYSMSPGGEFQGYHTGVRIWTITVTAVGASTANYHAIRKALINVLKPNATVVDQEMPIRYQYPGQNGPAIEIMAAYAGGLEEDMGYENFIEQGIKLTFHSSKPNWRAIYNSAINVFPTAGTLSVSSMAMRQNGLWNAMGTGLQGTNAIINCAMSDNHGNIWIGGRFTGVNGIAAVNEAAFNIFAGVWSCPGGGLGVSGNAGHSVNSLCILPNGDVVATGVFPATTGGTTVNNAARYPAAGPNWLTMGGATVGLTGLPAGGTFTGGLSVVAYQNSAYFFGTWTTAGGVAAQNAALWNPNNTFSAVAGGITMTAGGSQPQCAYVDNNAGKIIVGASANTMIWNGTTANPIVLTIATGATSSLGGNVTNVGSPGNIFAITAGRKGYIIAGTFDTIGTIAAANIALANGIGFYPLGTGVAGGNVTVYGLLYLPDGTLWAFYSYISSLINGGGIGAWNGSSWSSPGIVFPGNTAILATGVYSNFQNGTIAVFGQFTTISAISQNTVIQVGSTAEIHPTVIFTGPGNLQLIQNLTTGAAIYFNGYAMQTGEILTLVLEPGNMSFTTNLPNYSSQAPYSNISYAISPGSNLQAFQLAYGANTIGVLITNATNGVTGATLVWKETYLSNDGGQQ